LIVTETIVTTLAMFEPNELSPRPGSPEYREHVERGAVELARVFREATDAMRRHWTAFSAQCQMLDDVMAPHQEGMYPSRHFDVNLHYDGSRHSDYGDKSGIETIISKMNVKVWTLLVNHLGIKNLMSIKRREEFDRQIEKGDVPEVTEANILNVILGLADRAAEFATEAAKETLSLLTPANGHYKTNSGFRVGKRVVLPHYVERCWDGRSFRVNYYRDANITAIDGTFHVLDEKGLIADRKSPLAVAIAECQDGRGETDYFSFKCYKNGNLHIEFKRQDLVKKLNGLATGEYVLGQDVD
jgi:hypothetical protein